MGDFLKVQEAYERAVEFVAYCGDRRKWIADHVEAYLRQREAAAKVERLGGQVEFEEVDWLKQSVGDFAVLVERLRVIRLRNTAADDALMNFLAEQPSRTPYLIELDLADTRISDKGLQALTGLRLLQRLDLSGTRVTWRGLWATVEELPSLEKVGLAGTAIGWLSRCAWTCWYANARRRTNAGSCWVCVSNLGRKSTVWECKKEEEPHPRARNGHEGKRGRIRDQPWWF